MEICGQDFTEETVAWIREKVGKEPALSRSALSRVLCERLNWRSPNGQWKAMSGRVALSRLHRLGRICLPEAKAWPPASRRSVDEGLFAETPDVLECPLTQLGEIELVRIRGADTKVSLLWNALMERYHYLGKGPLCGAQMRYLVRSARYGYLGGLAFSAAAWRVQARDQWIGWEESVRCQNLQRVICNSRFLILPGVKVPHLASHILGRVARRLRSDWEEQYGLEPVLMETFVDPRRFQGTCYRAANWVDVGMTRGRGRQDRAFQCSVGVKKVFVFPLTEDWRERLCAGIPSPRIAKRPSLPLDWAEEEFGRADMRDTRLHKRLLVLARDLYNRPQASIPQACETRARTKAAYRFFEHAQATMETIFPSHFEATRQRICSEKVVLAVQDTTSLNYSAHPATEGMGPIGSRPEGIMGLMVHDTLAFNVEGTPLGLLDVQCWAREALDFGKKHRCRERPIEQKESRKWLVSFNKVAEAQRLCPKTMLVSVGDREADLYEFFALGMQDPKGPKLLVRAARNRLVTDEQEHLWEVLEKAPVLGVQVLHVPRRGNRSAREAPLEVRVKSVSLEPPSNKKGSPPLNVWAILAQEREVAVGVEPLQWMLLTTIPVETFDQATEKLGWYTRRWGIEVYHRTLKSGCKVEDRQLGHADRIEACLAIDMVVAWRIFHLTQLGRETPDVPCTVFFEEAEWKALHTYIHQTPVLPQEPPRLREAIRMTASLGGFLGRKSDGEPGTQSLWVGLQRLDDLTSMWKVLTKLNVPQPPPPPVSRGPTYG